MCADEVERLLAALPTRALSPAAEAEILHGILTAAPQRARWWARPTPLWQTVAACMVVAVAAGLFGGRARHATRSSGGQPVTVTQSAAFFEDHAKSRAYTLDIRRWRTLPAETKGVNER